MGKTRFLGLYEALGLLVGFVASPLVGILALVRGRRAFHPEGLVLRAEVTSAQGSPTPEAQTFAGQLTGPALVRLSGAMQAEGSPKGDILGCAIRFGVVPGAEPTAKPAASAQDLLLGTFTSFGAAKQAMANTNVQDYLANDYFTVGDYELAGVGPVALRLVGAPAAAASGGGSRRDRLAQAIAAGRAHFGLELATNGGPWQALCTVALREELPVDPAPLRFSPYRTGRGLRTRGFLSGARRCPYVVSQAVRRLRAG